jgi:hypothetical protein
MSKQTALQWLELEFVKLEYVIGVHSVMYELIDKAKQMEKEQIEEAYGDGQTISNAYQGASDYYNTEYGNG